MSKVLVIGDVHQSHQTAEQFLEQGKISRAGVQTFRDLMLHTESINYPYPMPGDPGFKPEII